MIALAGMDGADIPTNVSFGLVSDELTNTVISTEGTLQDDCANNAILWAYDVVFDRWEEIGRRVSAFSFATTAILKFLSL